MEQAYFKVVCVPSSDKGGPKMLYVWEKHIDLFVSILATLVSRFGVPYTDLLDDSVLAEAGQWFDMPTNRWHVRKSDTGEVVVSDPVPRLGLPLAGFQRVKAAALEALM